MGKTVIVLGGPNGAGKTTLARSLFLERLPDEYEFLNADLIADSISPFKPHKASIRAGKEFVNRFNEFVQRGVSFALESTLSGVYLTRWLSLARSQGYRVELVYLWLPNADFAVRRVLERVRRGGHSIPEAVIRRRFTRSYSNFIAKYRNSVDRWELLDGSKMRPFSVASGSKGNPIRVFHVAHAALSGFSNEDFVVEEGMTAYGSTIPSYTRNLGPILESVEWFLGEQERIGIVDTHIWTSPSLEF